jgi:hypothetical protein
LIALQVARGGIQPVQAIEDFMTKAAKHPAVFLS